MILSFRSGKSELRPIITALAVVLGDQLSKWWILETFVLHETEVVIPGLFNLTFVMNTGAAFGLFAGDLTFGRQFFFIAVAMTALVVLFFAYRHLKSQGRIYIIAIGLISGGALGNLIDRMRFGAVVDFFDFYIGQYHWPAFNIADSAICVGVGLFLLGNFFTSPPCGNRNKK
ncbi:MAG: signal peptidase II [Thermodesulfobacteriota bacterium]|nr:signal peptidase II [Thermodesulfobacteriota bacterium]